MSDDLKNIVEAVLLASDSPLTVARIQSLFAKSARPEAADIKSCIEKLQQECENRGVELKKISSGYRYQTREKYADYLRNLHAVKPPRLSRALLETLSIIAYRQPVTRGDIEEVRGVAVSPEIMQRLIEREWVKQVGVRDVPGRPALFGTTAEFLSYFNLESLKDLPSLMEQRDLGEIAGEMETPLPAEVLAALESSDDDIDEAEPIESAESAEPGQPIGDPAETCEVADSESGTPEQYEGSRPQWNQPGDTGQNTLQGGAAPADVNDGPGEGAAEQIADESNDEDEEDERPRTSARSGESTEETRPDDAAPVQELAASPDSQADNRGEAGQSAGATEINRVA